MGTADVNVFGYDFNWNNTLTPKCNSREGQNLPGLLMSETAMILMLRISALSWCESFFKAKVLWKMKISRMERTFEEFWRQVNELLERINC